MFAVVKPIAACVGPSAHLLAVCDEGNAFWRLSPMISFWYSIYAICDTIGIVLIYSICVFMCVFQYVAFGSSDGSPLQLTTSQIVFEQDGLLQLPLKPPYIAQPYVNHSSEVFKVVGYQ